MYTKAVASMRGVCSNLMLSRSQGVLLVAFVSTIVVWGPASTSFAQAPAYVPAASVRMSTDSGPATHHDVSPPLRSLPADKGKSQVFPVRPEPPLHALTPPGPEGATAGISRSEQSPLRAPEIAPESTSPFTALLTPATTANFDGIPSTGSVPPDPSGAAGLTQYVEVVNTELAVYSKTGTTLLGPVPTNTLWAGFGGGCETNNNGDGTVVFDTINQRWVIQQFSVGTTPYLDCVAVSTSGDATGTWYRYAFPHSKFPDYPKLGVWSDAYYASYNLFEGKTGPYVGTEVCALNRAAMLTGSAATQQCFTTSASAAFSLLPASLDGATPPPAGQPEWFVGLSRTTENALAYWKFDVDWANPAASTLTGPTNLAVQAFSKPCASCIPQSETTQQLESLGDRLMWPLSYRNFGDHEAMVVSHAVTAGSSVGMRWYELRPSGGTLTAHQQQTWAPDGAFRWMGSIAMDRLGDIAMGYSISSPTMHPGIRYAGRLASDPLGNMSQGEAVLHEGGGSQTPYAPNPRAGARWGDYTHMSIDPVDDCTFWYVNEYLPSNGVFNWRTRIGSFKFPECGVPTAATEAATNISPTGATFRGSINPRGAATKYRFEYGKTSAEAEPWEKSIPIPDGEVGSGTAEVKLSQAVTGLSPGTQYAYRIVAITKTDTVYGFAHAFTTSTQNWAVQSTPNPANAAASRLLANSCVSESNCMSVGRYVNSEGKTVPLAERWNGTVWSLQSPAAPSGAVSSELSGVSCPSATLCVAVGSYKDSTGTAKMFTSTWNGATWSNQTPPYPSESSKAELAAVSCPTTTWCMAVGNYWGGPYQHPLAEVWNGSSWSVSATPLSGLALLGVSCTSTTFCMATGYRQSEGVKLTFAEKWTGTWAVTTTPNRSFATANVLSGVSCVSPTSCKAVGSDKRSFQETLAEHWNGTSWGIVHSPNGVNSSASALNSISCTAASDCTAVGSYNDEGATVTFAERWDGSAWKTQGTKNPSATFNALFGISCTSGEVCIASGSYKTAAGTEQTLVEKGEGANYQPPGVSTKPASSSAKTVATLSGLITPNGLATQYHFEYGLTSSYGTNVPVPDGSLNSNLLAPQEVSHVVTGLQPDTTYHFRLVATNAKGATSSPDQTFTTPAWEILSTPNPSGASDTNLYDVSCEPSASVCTSVGKSTVSNADRPVAQRWNGSSWSEQPPDKKSGTLPTRLFGVDCPSETRCLAAGNYQPLEGGPALLTEIWNEGTWNVQSTPLPSGATSSELVAIGCSSTAQCSAVGSAMIGGVKTAIMERWTSPTWALSSIPIPEGAKSSQLDGVDCIWSNFCVAVGRYTTSGNSVKSLVMFWNGSWSLQTVTDPVGAVESSLLDVSCTKTPNRCTAVGSWKNGVGERFTLAYRFNGSSTWTLQSTPNPSGGTENVFQDISCATETFCTAVGSSVSGGSTKPLAESWNGTSWSIQGTLSPSAATFSSLFGVSCQGTTCVSAGWSTDASGVDSTLAEIR